MPHTKCSGCQAEFYCYSVEKDAYERICSSCRTIRDRQLGIESTVDLKDIELVMAQTNCNADRSRAALIKHRGDIVEAIIELTVS